MLDLPENVQILTALTRPSSLSKIKQFLQDSDEEVKTNCFKLLHHILCRTFDVTACNNWQSFSSLGAFSSSNKDSTKNEVRELQEAKKTVKEDLFLFMRDVV